MYTGAFLKLILALPYTASNLKDFLSPIFFLFMWPLSALLYDYLKLCEKSHLANSIQLQKKLDG